MIAEWYLYFWEDQKVYNFHLKQFEITPWPNKDSRFLAYGFMEEKKNWFLYIPAYANTSLFLYAVIHLLASWNIDGLRDQFVTHTFFHMQSKSSDDQKPFL